ncbi:MAG: hypothetical protein IT279_14860 [Ignavibacteriaceae bacterium]|nr:hypothetical protein [Ignavibacteriaceae bacterium]
MKTLINLKWLLRYSLLVLLTLTLVSCSEEDPIGTEDPTASKTKSDQATALLETEMFNMINNNYNSLSDLDQINMSAANSLFKEALTLDENNAQAQFGAAFTEFVMVYKDPDFNALIKDMDSSFNQSNSLKKLLSPTLLPGGTAGMQVPINEAGGVVFSIMKLAVKDPPLISRVQQVFRDKLLPRLDYAANLFAKLEANNSFKFVISGKMQGDPEIEAVALYPAEIYVMDAMMHGLKFAVDAFLVYKFDIPNYEQATLLAALNRNSTNFFYLAADGASRATAAKNDLNLMATKLLSGIASLESLSGTKPDAVIKIGNNGIKQNDLDTTKKYLNKFKDALTQDVTLHLKDADSEGNNYDIRINLGNFFSNPVQNPKVSFFPAYTVEPRGTDDIEFRFDAQTYNEFTFPDPTFGGLFPGMTNNTLKRLLYIDEEFAYRLEGHVNFPGGWFQDVQLKITAGNQTYTVDLEPYDIFELLVRDATGTGVEITRYALVISGQEFEQRMVNPNDRFFIQSQEHDWLEIRLPVYPQNLNGFAQGQNTVVLNWDGRPSLPWGDFNIYKKTGSGNFELNSSGYFSNQFQDFNVLPGISYTYRISNRINTEYYGYPALIAMDEVFSNQVTITP